MGWNNLPDMVMTSDSSDTSQTDGMEWLDKFYEQNHTIWNLEYMFIYFATSIQENCW